MSKRVTMLGETNMYSASIVGEWKTPTTGESFDSLPHDFRVCMLSMLILSPSLSLNTLIFKSSRIMLLNKWIKMSSKLKYSKFLLLANLMKEINLSFMFGLPAKSQPLL